MIRTKILFLSLCAMAVLAALLGIVQIWTNALHWDVFLKIMGTILIVGTELSFLMAVDYDLPASRRKWLMLGLVGVSGLATTIVTLQIWAQILEWAFFLKLMGTMGVGIVLIGFLLAVAEDFGTNKSLKDQNYVD